MSDTTIPPLSFSSVGRKKITAAFDESARAIPPFASANFGWQSSLEDWEDPPPGSGHGPMKNDPDYPFLSNLEGNRAGNAETS
jgi:hypothetical protein